MPYIWHWPRGLLIPSVFSAKSVPVRLRISFRGPGSSTADTDSVSSGVSKPIPFAKVLSLSKAAMQSAFGTASIASRDVSRMGWNRSQA